MNELLFPNDARHIAHCAKVDSANRKTHAYAIAASARIRIGRCAFICFCRPLERAIKIFRHDPSTEVLGYFHAPANADTVLLRTFGAGRRPGITQVPRAEAVREEYQQQTDGNYDCRHDCQHEVHPFKPQVHKVCNDQRRLDD
jgi:hypothetical protein